MRSVTASIAATLADSGACKVVDTQSAINGHWSQSTGADWSGQHGMSSDMEAASSAMAIEAFTAVLLNLNVRYKAHTTLRITGAGMPGSGVTPAAP